jgi:hypothetical protein
MVALLILVLPSGRIALYRSGSVSEGLPPQPQIVGETALHKGSSSEGAYPSKPKCGTGTIRQRVNPTVPAASRKHRPWTGQNLLEDSHATA